MIDRTDVFRSRTDGVVIPRIWIAIALSIFVHIAVLLDLPPITVQLPEAGEPPDSRAPLTLRLAPPAPPIPPLGVVPPQPSSEPSLRAQRPKAAPRPRSAPPFVAMDKPAPPAPSPAAIAPPAPAPDPGDDMASYIEARQRARGATTPAPPPQAEDADARSKRIIAGNIGSQRDRTFGYDPSKGGGVFQIQRLSHDYAEFLFHGWNNDINRNSKQLIEVRRGANSDIRIAVVRRMIAIIREDKQDEFLWVSNRLGRSVMLSARARDNAGLEEFMIREFFPDISPARR